MTMFPNQVFRANDIRGVAETELTDEFAYVLGYSFGLKVKKAGESSVLLCRDARLSSPRLHKAVSHGLSNAGIQVIDTGVGPTPLLAFGLWPEASTYLSEASAYLSDALSDSKPVRSGIMITASHNPANQNGFKITLSGNGFFGNALIELSKEMNALKDSVSFEKADGSSLASSFTSSLTSSLNLPPIQIDLQQSYINALKADVMSLDNIKVVVDAANGAAGQLAAKALKALNTEVIEQFCEPDGRFPNRSPDTGNPENLRYLQQRVVQTKADLGIGFDGDGDRMVAVTETGHLLNADQLIALFAKSTLESRPNSKVVFDVKCSPTLSENIISAGGVPLMHRSGRSFIQSKMKETNASFAGEYSAHYFFGDRWSGSDDGIYAACRLMELCKKSKCSLNELYRRFSGAISDTVATDEIRLKVAEEKKFELVDRLISGGNFELKQESPKVIQVDGLRLEYSFGWVLIRASNTSANLTLRLEAQNHSALRSIADKVVALFNEQIPEVDIKPGLNLLSY